jgi:hypothetical protein
MAAMPGKSIGGDTIYHDNHAMETAPSSGSYVANSDNPGDLTLRNLATVDSDQIHGKLDSASELRTSID